MIYKVLVVDDEAGIRTAIKRRLESTGDIHAETASNGFEAAAKLISDGFDCILLDIMMPGIDGLEVCRKLRESDETKHIPVVMVTALSDEERVKAAMSHGVSGYIRKPFKSEELINRVRSILDKISRDRLVNHETEKNKSENYSVDREDRSVFDYFSKFLFLGRGQKIVERLISTLNQNPGLAIQKDLIAADMMVVADLFRIANSVFYGHEKGITGIDDLLRMVGTAGFSRYILGSSENINHGSPEVQEFIQSGFWSQNLCRACLAEELGSHLKIEDTDELFMCGLFHDIGKLFLVSYYPRKYKAIRKHSELDKQKSLELERKTIGLDHAQLGLRILNEWNFPVSTQRSCSLSLSALSHEAFSELSGGEISIAVADTLSDLLASAGHTSVSSARAVKLLRIFFFERGIDAGRIISNAANRVNHIASQLELKEPYTADVIESTADMIIKNKAESSTA